MNEKKEIIKLFLDHYLKKYDTSHLLGIVLCGSFKNDDNNDFSDIDIQIIIDEKYNEKTNVKHNGGEIKRCVEMLNGYKFEYFERNIEGYYYETQETFKQQKNALLTIIGYGKIIYFKNEKALEQIKSLQEYILNTYSNPFPLMSKEETLEQLSVIMKDINVLLDMQKTKSIFISSFYYYLLEKIRKFYSRCSGCCYLPPAKILKLYQDKTYAERFCKSKLPKEEFLNIFISCLDDAPSSDEKICKLISLINWIIIDLKIEFMDIKKHDYDELNFMGIDNDEIVELIVILENRRNKLNEKYIKSTFDYVYFYYIVLQMIQRFVLKISTKINILNGEYFNIYTHALKAQDNFEKSLTINSLLDYVKSKCEKNLKLDINPIQYRIRVKPTTWNEKSQTRF